ncbi:MAG: ribulose-phosphate 3-epimerase [Phycisphaerae bacterium]
MSGPRGAARESLKSARLRVAPSLLAADFARLRDEVARVEAGGADLLHLDVMDGHYVNNISFGIPVIERLRPHTRLYFDTHLMISEPARYADAFIAAGADGITFHTEVVREPGALIDRLRAAGVGVGVSLNPHTPVAALEPCLAAVDLVNVMTVEPGFGGQAFLAEMLGKVRALAGLLRDDQRLEVDGGIGPATVGAAVAAGADTLVAGTAVFGAADAAAAIAALRGAAEAARRMEAR